MGGRCPLFSCQGQFHEPLAHAHGAWPPTHPYPWYGTSARAPHLDAIKLTTLEDLLGEVPLASHVDAL
jgi:hypothetical protein